MGILILASKDVQIWMRDAVFSSANFGIDDSISKLTDAQGLIRHLINQRRVCLQWGVFGDWNNRELPSSIMAFGHKISRLQWKLIHKVLRVYCQIGLCQGAHTHTSSIFAKDGIVISIYFTYESFPLISAVYLFVLAQVGIYPKHTKVIFFITVDIFGRRA